MAESHRKDASVVVSFNRLRHSSCKRKPTAASTTSTTACYRGSTRSSVLLLVISVIIAPSQVPFVVSCTATTTAAEPSHVQHDSLTIHHADRALPIDDESKTVEETSASSEGMTNLFDDDKDAIGNRQNRSSQFMNYRNTTSTTQQQQEASSPKTNNWAVIVDASRYWYNYRHSANALSFYHIARRLGIPDNRIILMLAEDIACNSRNIMPGTEYNDNRFNRINLYGDDIEVDFRGDEVTVDNFIRLITGRQSRWTPRSKRLLTDEFSNIFVYMTGHSGAEFMKFQDWEELPSQDIADAFQQLWLQKRYSRVLFVVDTCQAATLGEPFYSPRIIALGSSLRNQNSYSHHLDGRIGCPIIDRFTYSSLDFLKTVFPWSQNTMQEYFDSLTFDDLHSTPNVRTDLSDIPLSRIKVTDFFGSSGSTTLKFIDAPFCMESPDATL